MRRTHAVLIDALARDVEVPGAQCVDDVNRSPLARQSWQVHLEVDLKRGVVRVVYRWEGSTPVSRVHYCLAKFHDLNDLMYKGKYSPAIGRENRIT